MSLAAKFDPKLQAQSTCTLLNNTLVYDYKPFLLLVSYGAAIAIGVVSAAIGFQSIFGPNKGKVGDTSFSGILAATRNEGIDAALMSKAGENAEESLMKTKLRYGRLKDGRDAFGSPEDFRN
ncbi:hypothetical protein FRC03_001924 [Tulasnella sp. 419]|nr:hypothetical protein FRC03_001924 [Tulasnella sp. 419]